MLGLVSKGFLIGVLVSAPMGPIGMLCIQRTLSKGRWHGFITGLGVALSDIIYAALTCLCMGMVVSFVEANLFRRLYSLSGCQLFSDTGENDNVGIHCHTDGKNDTGNTGQCQGNIESV
jgi:arginine exporter protein ArgO